MEFVSPKFCMGTLAGVELSIYEILVEICKQDTGTYLLYLPSTYLII
jgi:hypothetical protein